MKKLLIPSLSLGLLAKTILVSHALTFTLYVDDRVVHTNPADTTYENGVFAPNTVGGDAPFRSAFTPSNSDNNISAAYSTAPTSPFGSVVNFGTIATVGGNGANPPVGTAFVPNSGTFNSTVTFSFDLQNGSHSGFTDFDPIAAQDAFDSFVVTGTVSGSVSYGAPGAGASSALFTLTSITNQTTGVTSTVTASSPNNGKQTVFIPVNIGGTPYNIYINQVVGLPKPGATQAVSISGYIASVPSAVPEPGAMALLLGFGATGAAFLRRRRK